MKYFLWRSLWTVLLLVNLYGFSNENMQHPEWQLVSAMGVIICFNELFEPRKKNG